MQRGRGLDIDCRGRERRSSLVLGRGPHPDAAGAALHQEGRGDQARPALRTAARTAPAGATPAAVGPPSRDHRAWTSLLDGEELPLALVDLDALDHNLAIYRDAARGSGKTVRIGSKSVRCPALLRYLLEHGGPELSGILSFSPWETRLLAAEGFDDLLCAYPVSRREGARVFAQLASEGVRAVAMVDCAAHVVLLGSAGAEAGVEVPVCIDLDASWRPLSGVHLGVRRSPLRGAEAVVALARVVRETPGVCLDGLMSYEAQVAGLPDRTPGGGPMDIARRLVKARSRPVVLARRGAAVHALRDAGFTLPLVNGGGSGSLHFTLADPAVTETTAGSAFYCPHGFDGFDDLDLRPAAFFALEVVRSSDPGLVTCAGGGYVASGELGPSRLPVVHSPPGLRILDMEAWGEVQTPLRLPADVSLDLGDPVVCRHAKAGELLERFATVLLVRGEEIVDRVPSYRGLGAGFT